MKAILLIDEIPTECIWCPCYDHEGGWCQASNSWKTDRENGCPLKPMPKEEDIYEVGMDEEDTNAKRQWNKGWNACLKELEK